MSNYYTKAKRREDDEWKEVEMLDNYFGAHRYGVKFPNGEVVREEKCKIKTNYDKFLEKEMQNKEVKKEIKRGLKIGKITVEFIHNLDDTIGLTDDEADKLVTAIDKILNKN